MKDFFRELQRRRVYTVGVAYTVAGWLLLQVADTILPIYETPEWVLKAFTTLLFLGFPLALALAWIFDLKGGHLVRTGADPGGNDRQDNGGGAQRVIELPTGPSVAVLPFANLGGDAEQDLFAEALTGDIITGLTRSSHLFVLSAGATAGVNPERPDTVQKLGVSYLLKGAVQKAGETLRVSATLEDAHSGVQAWSQNYDKQLNAENMFAVQDDIREKIVATLSDLHGVIYSVQGQQSMQRPTDNLDAYQCLSVALTYDKYISEENHRIARDSLERAVELDPHFDEAWSHLSWIYADEVIWGFNPRPDSMKRALDAALKGVKLGPGNYHNHWLLSRVYYFMGEKEAFHTEAGRALELNSSDGTTLGLIGLYTAWAGDWERGSEMIEKAKLLNPNYPDYYHIGLGSAGFARQDWPGALKELLKANLPEFPPQPIFLAATYAMLERHEDAAQQAAQIQRLLDGADISMLRNFLGFWFPFIPDYVEQICAGLVRAGIPLAPQS